MKMRIEENGEIKEVEVAGGDLVMTKKIYHVQKGGGDLYFGSMKMMVDTVEDLGVALNTCYKHDWHCGMKTRTGYTVKRGKVLSLPNLLRRNEEGDSKI